MAIKIHDTANNQVNPVGFNPQYAGIVVGDDGNLYAHDLYVNRVEPSAFPAAATTSLYMVGNRNSNFTPTIPQRNRVKINLSNDTASTSGFTDAPAGYEPVAGGYNQLFYSGTFQSETNGYEAGGDMYTDLLPTGQDYNSLVTLRKFPFAGDTIRTVVSTLAPSPPTLDTTPGKFDVFELNPTGNTSITQPAFAGSMGLTKTMTVSSGTDGYVIGGVGKQPSSVGQYNKLFRPDDEDYRFEVWQDVWKWPFASDYGVATAVRDVVPGGAFAGGSAESRTHGYIMGYHVGLEPTANTSPPSGTTASKVTTVQKFPFAGDTTFSVIGDLVALPPSSPARDVTITTTSGTAAFQVDDDGTIYKFPFAAEITAVDTGGSVPQSYPRDYVLYNHIELASMGSTETHAHIAGNYNSSPTWVGYGYNSHHKFPFSISSGESTALTPLDVSWAGSTRMISD